MISEEQLQSYKEEWRRQVLDSIGQALKAIEEQMPEAAAKHNALLSLKGRLNDANQKKIMGLLSNEQLQLLYNQLRHDILLFIDELVPADFEAATPTFGSSPDQPRRGALLHKIPRKMAVGKEEECIIRLAYERAVIANDLEITEEVEVREVTISKVMEAELIDPNEEPAFKIRSFSDEEQFLQEGEYTEWRFYVKPLRAGAFPLLLKITVVEVIAGKERLRNISWEETVQIVAAAEEVPEAAFASSGINLAFGKEESTTRSYQPSSPTLTGDRSGQSLDDILQDVERAYSPPAPAPPPRQEKQSEAKPIRSKRVSRMRKFSIAASIAIVLGMAFLYIGPFQNDSGIRPGEEVKTNPSGGDVEPEPVEDMKSEAENAWEKAKAADTKAAYEAFIKQYPESEWAEEARERLNDLE